MLTLRGSMLTLRDYKAKVKKIINVFIPSIIKVKSYKYKGHTIYEDLYAFNDFYYQTPNDGWIVHGSYKQLTKLIDHELTSPPVKIHARHTPPPIVLLDGKVSIDEED